MACCKDCEQLGDAAAALASIAKLPVAHLIQIGGLAIAGLVAVAVMFSARPKKRRK